MIPLMVRSSYSLMWGVNSPREICKAARKMGYGRMALTDTDNLYGLWPFISACEEFGIKPLVGAELTEPGSKDRAVCLVENKDGYRSLCRLISLRKQGKGFRLAEIVAEFSKGLVILTSSPRLLKVWSDREMTVAADLAIRPCDKWRRLRALAMELGLPSVATPGSFFLYPDGFMIHRLLRAIDLKKTISSLTPEDTAHKDAWLAPAHEYAKRFSRWPDVVAASGEIGDRLGFIPGRELVMPPWRSASGISPDQALREAAYEGAGEKYGEGLHETVVERLEHELKVIAGMNFSSYFLVVKGIVSKSPRICGRGSGASSLVAYCLGITNICPVRHNLYFERFLNPGRSDPPDIDVDFAWDERDGVIDSVLNEFKGHSAMVCCFVCFQPALAIRETARAFGLTHSEIGRVTKRLPWSFRFRSGPGGVVEELKRIPRMGGFGFQKPWPEILRLAAGIAGSPRHVSVHPGGVVITPRPIVEYVPMEISPKGVPIIQWDKDGAETGGLVKIDLLGNRSLGVIRDALANIRENGVNFPEESWKPEDDPSTIDAVEKGLTMGCFYIESPAMRLLQKKTGKGDFSHLVIHSSIIRPAANTYIKEYVKRVHKMPWKPIHPIMAEILEETHGIMVYQEDVAKVAMALAGFSHGEADGLRKILSKKNRAGKLGDFRERFEKGAGIRGLGEGQIKALWKMIESFGGYSFCKAHSASYARVSFQCAYLKTHYPAEFMAAVINNQGGYYGRSAYVSEAKRAGVAVMGPKINESEIHWRGEGKKILVGFSSIAGLAALTMEKIISSRKTGRYTSLADFLERVEPYETEARALIHAGAFDDLHHGVSRISMLWELVSRLKASRTARSSPCLFSMAPPPSPEFPKEDFMDRLRREFKTLGFLCGTHPMEVYRPLIQRLRLVKAVEIEAMAGRIVCFAGFLVTGKLVHTKNGEPMEFLTFEDETGLVETIFFPNVYKKFSAVIDRSRPFLLNGRVDKEYGAVSLTVSSAALLPQLFQDSP